MDGSRFDAWTRRRFGIAVGGATLAESISLISGIAAKRKKRCKRLGKPCSPGGRKCCKTLKCRDIGDPNPDFRCCRPDGQSCANSDQCCSGCNSETHRCEAA